MCFSIDPLHAHLKQASAADALRVLWEIRDRVGCSLTEAPDISGDVGGTARLAKIIKKWRSEWVGQTFFLFLCARYFEVRRIDPGPWSQSCRPTLPGLGGPLPLLCLCFGARLGNWKPAGTLYNKQVEEIVLWDLRCDGPKVIILLSNQGEEASGN